MDDFLLLLPESPQQPTDFVLIAGVFAVHGVGHEAVEALGDEVVAEEVEVLLDYGLQERQQGVQVLGVGLRRQRRN